MKKIAFLVLIAVAVLFLVGCEKAKPKTPSPVNEPQQPTEIPAQITEIYFQKGKDLENLAGKGLFMPRLKAVEYRKSENRVMVYIGDCQLIVSQPGSFGSTSFRYERPDPTDFKDIKYIRWHDEKKWYILPVEFVNYDDGVERVTFNIRKE